MSAGSDIAAQIAAALAEAGAAVGDGPLIGVIKRKGANTGPDNKPVYGPELTYNFTVILGSFSERERADTAIKATDTKITVSVGAVVPAVSDKIAIQGVDYQIYGVDPLKAGGIDLMFKVWARA
jgi:hypothetical protein